MAPGRGRGSCLVIVRRRHRHRDHCQLNFCQHQNVECHISPLGCVQVDALAAGDVFCSVQTMEPMLLCRGGNQSKLPLVQGTDAG